MAKLTKSIAQAGGATQKPERAGKSNAEEDFDIVAKCSRKSTSSGIDTSFYKAGLSSISAMKLCVLISEEFGVTVKTSDIHENNTVEKLEKYVMLAPKLRTYEKREVYPLTGPRRVFLQNAAKILRVPYTISPSFLNWIQQWIPGNYPMQLPEW